MYHIEVDSGYIMAVLRVNECQVHPGWVGVSHTFFAMCHKWEECSGELKCKRDRKGLYMVLYSYLDTANISTFVQPYRNT